MSTAKDTSRPAGMARPDTGATVGGSMRRLLEAISALEEAVESRLQREQLLGEAEAEVQRMGADRSRLAEALDASAARAQRLEATNKEVSRRLVDAMEAIRTVLDGPSERPA